MDGIGHLGAVIGGDDVGMFIFYNLGNRLHDALNIDDHGFNCSGCQHHFLLNKGTCDRDTSAHQDLITGAADTGQIDALGPGLLGQSKNLFVIGSQAERLRQKRLMTVHGYIDHVFTEHAKIDNGPYWNRGTEHDIS